MDLPSQSGIVSPKYVDSEDDETMNRAQIRKNNKPLLEKKRRARINSSLEQLKSLVLDALKKDSARYSKLEKADILEMTVKHLRELQRQQMAAAMTIDPSVVSRYQSGFGECAQEVQRYLRSIDGLSAEVRLRLMHHLTNYMHQVHQICCFGGVPLYGAAAVASSASSSESLPGTSARHVLPLAGFVVTSSADSSFPPGVASAPYGSGDPSYGQRTRASKADLDRRLSDDNDETELTAPVEPLSEKSVNLNHPSDVCKMASSGRYDDDNNNSICVPLAKRRKMETRKDLLENKRNYENGDDDQNVFDIKSESVWRPW